MSREAMLATARELVDLMFERRDTHPDFPLSSLSRPVEDDRGDLWIIELRRWEPKEGVDNSGSLRLPRGST